MRGWLKLKGFQPLPTNKLQPLMDAVTTKGPVVVSIDAGGWNSYGGGIFVLCLFYNWIGLLIVCRTSVVFEDTSVDGWWSMPTFFSFRRTSKMNLPPFPQSMHLRRPFGIPAILRIAVRETQSSTTQSCWSGTATQQNTTRLAWQHDSTWLAQDASCGAGCQLSCFWICCSSLARTIGTFAILGEIPGEKVDLFACYATVATREKLVTAEWIAIQRPWLEASAQSDIMILWSNVWCASFCICVYFQLPHNRMTARREQDVTMAPPQFQFVECAEYFQNLSGKHMRFGQDLGWQSSNAKKYSS